MYGGSFHWRWRRKIVKGKFQLGTSPFKSLKIIPQIFSFLHPKSQTFHFNCSWTVSQPQKNQFHHILINFKWENCNLYAAKKIMENKKINSSSSSPPPPPPPRPTLILNQTKIYPPSSTTAIVVAIHFLNQIKPQFTHHTKIIISTITSSSYHVPPNQTKTHNRRLPHTPSFSRIQAKRENEEERQQNTLPPKQ